MSNDRSHFGSRCGAKGWAVRPSNSQDTMWGWALAPLHGTVLLRQSARSFCGHAWLRIFDESCHSYGSSCTRRLFSRSTVGHKRKRSRSERYEGEGGHRYRQRDRGASAYASVVHTKHYRNPSALTQQIKETQSIEALL